MISKNFLSSEFCMSLCQKKANLIFENGKAGKLLLTSVLNNWAYDFPNKGVTITMLHLCSYNLSIFD